MSAGSKGNGTWQPGKRGASFERELTEQLRQTAGVARVIEVGPTGDKLADLAVQRPDDAEFTGHILQCRLNAMPTGSGLVKSYKTKFAGVLFVLWNPSRHCFYCMMADDIQEGARGQQGDVNERHRIEYIQLIDCLS